MLMMQDACGRIYQRWQRQKWDWMLQMQVSTEC